MTSFTALRAAGLSEESFFEELFLETPEDAFGATTSSPPADSFVSVDFFIIFEEQ